MSHEGSVTVIFLSEKDVFRNDAKWNPFFITVITVIVTCGFIFELRT